MQMTRQRRLILEQFSHVGGHLTADMVYDSVRKVLPNISLGTVYRNLDVLSRSGKIRKLDFGCGHSWYDGCTSPHDHVRCVKCGRLSDVVTNLPEQVAQEVSRCTDFDILGHELEFQGLCPQCREAERSAENQS